MLPYDEVLSFEYSCDVPFVRVAVSYPRVLPCHQRPPAIYSWHTQRAAVVAAELYWSFVCRSVCAAAFQPDLTGCPAVKMTDPDSDCSSPCDRMVETLDMVAY